MGILRAISDPNLSEAVRAVLINKLKPICFGQKGDMISKSLSKTHFLHLFWASFVAIFVVIGQVVFSPVLHTDKHFVKNILSSRGPKADISFKISYCFLPSLYFLNTIRETIRECSYFLVYVRK